MKRGSQVLKPRPSVELRALVMLAFLDLVLWCAPNVWAKPMSAGEAKKAVRGWLKMDANRLGTFLGQDLGHVDTFADDDGEPIYYAVNLEPSGFVIVPADDLVEPIVCFVARGVYDPSDDNPLGALVSADVPGRVAAARGLPVSASGNLQQGKASEQQAVFQKAEGKWAKLREYDDMVVAKDLNSISDVRVDPLVQSTWGQYTYIGDALYNYYTPGADPLWSPGRYNNYPCGCVATAMAQLMRFHEHPTTGIGVHSFGILVDGNSVTADTRGGDGLGGPYVWSDMLLEPYWLMPEAQRQAAGALCYDASVSISTQYTPTASSASPVLAKNELKDTFGYSNCIWGSEEPTIGAGLNGMINTNLDANYPVMLSVRRQSAGHAVLADGYGYDLSTLYHHLNMGWNGSNNAWYDLPKIDACHGSYNRVDGCVYNIFVSGSGEIISGRVTDANGSPLSDVTVTAEINGGGSYITTTNSRGIYSLVKVPSSTTFTVGTTASELGLYSLNQIVTTGTSTDSESTSGNIWAVDFVMGAPTPPVAESGSGSTHSGVLVTLTLEAYDEGHPDASGVLSYIITSLPEHGRLRDLGAGVIGSDDLPYTLVGNGNQVDYCPCFYYAGPDSFGFKANDGGTAPEGGDSNPATISIEVQGQPQSLPEVVYETDFEGGLPAGWSIVDGYSDGETWTSTNPAGRTQPHWTGTFMIVDSEWAGWVYMDEELITHSIDCSNYEDVTLNFVHTFIDDSDEIGDVDVSVNGGAWQNVARYDDYDYGLVELDLSSIADGQSDVRIRWHYYDARYEWFWGFDDVEVIASVVLPPIRGDLVANCVVDDRDLAVLCEQWLCSGLSADVAPNGGDGIVNFVDWAVFADGWQIMVGYDDLADFAEQWLEREATIADVAPDGGDGIVNMHDFAALAENWLTSMPLPTYVEFYEDFETGDFSQHNWLHGGNAGWTVASGVFYEGGYSAKSGTISNGEESILEITLDVTSNNISFYQKVSTLRFYNYMRFYIDGDNRGEWSGEHDWGLLTYAITPGQHTFKWSYEKAVYVGSGSDCAWIDNIRLYSVPAE